MAFKVLIPYNFTLNDEKTLDFVGQRYRDEKEIEIFLFHAYPLLPEIDVKQDPVMEKMKSNLLYLQMQQEEHKQALEAARAKLVEFGFKSVQIHSLFRPMKSDVATDIIQLSKKEHFNAIVMSRSPGSIINFFTRSNSRRIEEMLNGQIPVYIVN